MIYSNFLFEYNGHGYYVDGFLRDVAQLGQVQTTWSQNA